jgi:carboxyl-terminal processing protease
MKKEIFGYKILSLFILFLSATVLFSSCRKDEEEEDLLIVEENEDFYRLMKDWYFWYDEIPNLNPSSFPSPYELLEAMRRLPLDRWSYITSRQEFESWYRESKFIGYGFGSGWDQNARLRITFIYSSTDLYEAGVRRGWLIERINGTPVRPGANINQMLGANQVGVSNTFVFIDPEGAEIEVTAAKQEVIMNSVLHREVIESGGRKIGYMVFQNFTTPSFDELDETFEFFHSAGIDDLVLDLRYNGGGQTNVANYLASLIGGNGVNGKPFAKYIYNDKKKSENRTDLFNAPANSLGLGRVFTIATRRTASASEMVINGLRPFVDVYVIGDNTYGKPMGMNAWFWGDLYAFVPVTFKIANADDFGDYFEGLPADAFAADDITRAFGDPLEASLQEALHFIETGVSSMQPKKKSLHVQPWEQMTGLRQEIGAH